MAHREPSQRSASVLESTPRGSVLVAPTAMQAEAVRHATPASTREAERRFGLFMVDQAVPFQCSMRARSYSGRVVGWRVMGIRRPTAVQSDTLLQATPSRLAVVCAGGSGLRSVAHRVPFQL